MIQFLFGVALSAVFYLIVEVSLGLYVHLSHTLHEDPPHIVVAILCGFLSFIFLMSTDIFQTVFVGLLIGSGGITLFNLMILVPNFKEEKYFKIRNASACLALVFMIVLFVVNNLYIFN